MRTETELLAKLASTEDLRRIIVKKIAAYQKVPINLRTDWQLQSLLLEELELTNTMHLLEWVLDDGGE
jgi:hypothetical protein